MSGRVPSRAAGGADQRIALGFAVQFGQPDVTQAVDGGGIHGGLLDDVAGLDTEDAAKTLGRGSGDLLGSEPADP
jgi:hypothetical protein